ncbi:MAG: helix-turn-helix domain-containing protein, partial [Desulfuromusa sp.]|nr:helix-turn-helix domain-containing protein [Desulfuromusa sp.]
MVGTPKKSSKYLGQRCRGQLTTKKDRESIILLIKEAISSGARQSKACEIIGISAKTLQRWMKPDNHKDGRKEAKHAPKNKLTE